MFKHSVKVPRLYKCAATVVRQVKEEGASIKNLIYQAKHTNLKGIYALASEALKKSNVLDYLIRNTQILIKENRLDPWLTRVLITELIWRKQSLTSDCKPVQTILKYKDQLIQCLTTFTGETVKETKKVHKPRYVRVNTFKLSVPEAIDIFRDEGWILLRCGDNSDYAAYLATLASLSGDHFIIDIHVKDLLVFPPKTEFYMHHLYKNGSIILQDKASCLPPLLLSPTPNSSILDMCSAPGMKASQLATLVGDKGTVYAVERDQRRFQTLCTLMNEYDASNVKCINRDVLTVSSKEFPDVEYILVDPSCSGSGIQDRFEYENVESKCNKSRLQSLAGFQITILRHALLNFPKVKRVIYSTCSIYSEENESVIQQVIGSVRDYKLVDLKEKIKSKWQNYGSEEFGEIGTRCLYAQPEGDFTNGFFVALFERITDGETNEFFFRRVKRSSECEKIENQDYCEENSEEFEEQKLKKANKNYDNSEQNKIEDVLENKEESKKKKKSKKHEVDNGDSTKKCKKGNKNDNIEKKIEDDVLENIEESKKKKEKKSKKHEVDNGDSTKKCKKSKKEKSKNITDDLNALSTPVIKKSSKRNHDAIDIPENEIISKKNKKLHKKEKQNMKNSPE